MSTINITPIATNNPIDLKASNVIKGIALDWTDFGDTKSTLIYRSNTNNRANAVVITDTLANSYVDTKISYNQSYYYWIKFINQWGRSDGSFYPLNALSGVSITPSQVLTVDIIDNAVTDFAFVTDDTTRHSAPLTAYNEYELFSPLQLVQTTVARDGDRLEVESGKRGGSTSISISGFFNNLEYRFRSGVYDATLAKLKNNYTQSNFAGNYKKGNGYSVNNIITLNCGANVRVDSVGAIGNVENFTVISSTDSVAYGYPLDRLQTSTTGSGTGFALTDIDYTHTVGDFEYDYEDRTIFQILLNILLSESATSIKSYLYPTIAGHKYNVFLEDFYGNNNSGNASSNISLTFFSTYIKISDVKK